MFEKTVEHYKQKFENQKDLVNIDDVEDRANAFGIHNLKKELLANSIEFKDFALTLAKVMPGQVSCVLYSIVISKLADKYNIPYKKYVGFCIPKNLANYEENINAYNKGKEKGEEHPVFATHMYVVINDSFYEYYSGSFDNIEHIDVVEI